MTTCMFCGCSDENACVDDNFVACQWVAKAQDGDVGICSSERCVARAREAALIERADVDDDPPGLLAPSRELILPGDPEFHL